jgi:hypothetical protein
VAAWGEGSGIQTWLRKLSYNQRVAAGVGTAVLVATAIGIAASASGGPHGYNNPDTLAKAVEATANARGGPSDATVVVTWLHAGGRSSPV